MLESSYYMNIFEMTSQCVKFNRTLAKKDLYAYQANYSSTIYLRCLFANRFSKFFHVVTLKPNSEQLVKILRNLVAWSIPNVLFSFLNESQQCDKAFYFILARRWRRF